MAPRPRPFGRARLLLVKFLLDTNVLSEPARPQPRPEVIEWLDKNLSDSGTASTVWHELRYGALRLPDSNKKTGLLRYLREVLGPQLTILPYDQEAADWHARERARLTNLGKTPPLADAQIAGVAATRGLTLVTFHAADYGHFNSLQIIEPLKA